MSVSKWAPGAVEDGKVWLNSGQIKAVKLVLRNRFQLIQGPPGQF